VAGERLEELLRETDRVFVIVTLAVWVSLTVYAAALVASSGVAGGGIVFVVYALALIVWGKLVRDWMQERKRLLEKLAGGEGSIGEEIRRLREAIERLRESLES